MNKYKLFSPFVTLLAALITLVLTIHWNYPLKDMLVTLLIVIVIFLIISTLIQNRIHKFVEANEELAREEAEKEGAVIEKEAPIDEEAEEETSTLPPLTGAMPNVPEMANEEGTEFRSRPGSNF